LAPPGLALLAQLHERGHHHRHHLDDDGGGDVGHHAHGEDRQARQRPAREQVHDAEDRVGAVAEETRHFCRVHPRHRDEGTDAVDDQRADQEEEPVADLSGTRDFAERGAACGGGGHMCPARVCPYASILPPAASIAARAPLVAATPLSVTAFLISPESTTLTRSVPSGTTPAFSRASRSTTAASTLASSCRRTSARERLRAERKPTFGIRRCSGIWPPSKPTL